MIDNGTETVLWNEDVDLLVIRMLPSRCSKETKKKNVNIKSRNGSTSPLRNIQGMIGGMT